MIHAALAGIFCTIGLVLVAAEAYRIPEHTTTLAFSILYGGGAFAWVLLSFYLEQWLLMVIGSMQLFSCVLLLLLRQNLRD